MESKYEEFKELMIDVDPDNEEKLKEILELMLEYTEEQLFEILGRLCIDDPKTKEYFDGLMKDEQDN